MIDLIEKTRLLSEIYFRPFRATRRRDRRAFLAFLPAFLAAFRPRRAFRAFLTVFLADRRLVFRAFLDFLAFLAFLAAFFLPFLAFLAFLAFFLPFLSFLAFFRRRRFLPASGVGASISSISSSSAWTAIISSRVIVVFGFFVCLS